MAKFIINGRTDAENEYCRAVMKLTDASLTDGDFTLITTDDMSWVQWKEYIKDIPSPRPWVVMPVPISGLIGGPHNYDDWPQLIFPIYPGIEIFIPFYNNEATWTFPTSLPEAFVLAPDKMSGICAMGAGANGLTDWFTGNGLEFVEEAPIMYMDSGTPVTSFAITNVTDQGSGVARIYSAQLLNFAAAKMFIHISGVSGFTTNPNGRYAIQSLGSGYATINQSIGTGSFSGPAICKIHFASGAVAVVAAKIKKIADARGCGYWEARHCARMTGSESGVWSNTKGYGSINVSAAIAYSGGIPVDPYDTLGGTTTLAVSISSEHAVFSHAAEVVNAKKIQLLQNGLLVDEKTMAYGEAYGYDLYPVKLDLQKFRIKGIRDKQVTALSNEVSTNIANLTAKPPAPKFPEGFTIYFNVNNNWSSGAVVKINQSVTNPQWDNKGIVETEYILNTGDVVKETDAYASLRHLLSIRSGEYFNKFYLILAVSAFAISADNDMCGMDFSNTDFTSDGDFDFSNLIVANTTFFGATLPAAYDKAFFKSSVLYYDPVTTIWTDGEPIGE